MYKLTETLVTSIAELLKKRQLQVVTAESCTGGLIAQLLTHLSGSSQWFERGFVTYSNQAKQDMLAVPADILAQHGAVSEAVALAMAEGALTYSLADISLAVTGIAGPAGGTPEKPVGTVWFAWADKIKGAHASLMHFSGSRLQIREQAAVYALQGLFNHMGEHNG